MRAYEESHPWITFRATDFNELDPKLWMLLGEARSKCEHLAGAPLRPDVARHLYEVTLVKGALATAAIEGNTLTEEQAEGIFRGTYKAPPSRAYQEREIRNVLDSLMAIDQQVMTDDRPVITKELICEYNRQILDGTEFEPQVVPGEIRDYSVGVPGYRGAPAEDCEHLVERLAEWLEGGLFKADDPEIRFALAVACAIYAHLYIAWIHPFGDGNGRTARLLEFLILAGCGMVPLPAAHLLSDHYNLTRAQYYRELGEAGRTKKTKGFVTYAVQGLVDGIRDQIDRVRMQQFNVTWTNYVYETMNQFSSSPSRDRQRSLVLAMPSGQVVPRNELEGLTPKLAARYAKSGPRTLARDLNRLTDVGLIVKRERGWLSNDQIIRAFLPPIANEPGTS
ncbi:MAG: Fic family protein [Acidimicrobiales bacterium]